MFEHKVMYLGISFISKDLPGRINTIRHTGNMCERSKVEMRRDILITRGLGLKLEKWVGCGMYIKTEGLSVVDIPEV